MPPAAPDDIARAEAALGRPLPARYASFLRSFDGADLFHETLLIAGVGRRAALLAELAPASHRRADVRRGAVRRSLRARRQRAGLRDDPGADERALAGTTFERWLDATVAREQILFGPDGEYAPDVFDPVGQEVLPKIALRQAERALKADPGAADASTPGVWPWSAWGGGSRRSRRSSAATSSTRNTWPWFDLGRTALELGRARGAGRVSARGRPRAGPTGARLLAWAVRAAGAAGTSVGDAAAAGGAA